MAIKAIMISAVLVDLMRSIKAASAASAPVWGVIFTHPDGITAEPCFSALFLSILCHTEPGPKLSLNP